MKVVHICPLSISDIGVIQAQVLGLLEAQTARGIDAYVLAPADQLPPSSRVYPLGNSIPTAVGGSLLSLAPDAAAQLRGIRFIRDESPDLIHLHEPTLPGMTMTTSVIHPTPTVATLYAGSVESRVWRAFTLSSGKRIPEWVSRRTNRYCAVSPAGARRADSLGRSAAQLFLAVDASAIRRAHGHLRKRFTVVVPVDPLYSLTDLYWLHEQLLALDRDIEVVHVGDPPKTLPTPEDERVTYTRFGLRTSKDRVEGYYELLKSADVLCALKSRSYLPALELLEAMAAELPTVATDIEEHQFASGAVAMVRPFDSQGLARAFAALNNIADPMFEHLYTRSVILQTASFDRLAVQYESVYREVLDRSTHPERLWPSAWRNISEFVPPREFARSSGMSPRQVDEAIQARAVVWLRTASGTTVLPMAQLELGNEERDILTRAFRALVDAGMSDWMALGYLWSSQTALGAQSIFSMLSVGEAEVDLVLELVQERIARFKEASGDATP